MGEFIVLDPLELQGNDAFMVQFDPARIISFLPLKGELPVIHAVVGPNSKQLTISKDGFISGDAENNWLGAQRKMQLDLIDYTDSMDAITSNAGWDTIQHKDFLSEVISEFKSSGIRTSIFVDPVLKSIEGAASVGADRIELYTETFAKQYAKGDLEAVVPYDACAKLAHQLQMGVNAGHDLSLENISFFAKNVSHLAEVSIGHALISEAIYKGLQPTIEAYLSNLE